MTSIFEATVLIMGICLILNRVEALANSVFAKLLMVSNSNH